MVKLHALKRPTVLALASAGCLWGTSFLFGKLALTPKPLFTEKRPRQFAVFPQRRLEKILPKVATGFSGQTLATNSNMYERASYPLNMQQKQMVKALRGSEARCQAMFEAATIGIALVNTEGHFLETNSAL